MASADAAAFDDGELEVWSALATVLEWLPPALDVSLMRDAELTHFEFGILFALADAPDRTLRMSSLAAFSRSSMSRLSRAVSRLETRELVHRNSSPADGRSILATLTDEGAQTMQLASPGHVETVRRLVLGPLTARQRAQLGEISARIARAIRDDAAWRPSLRVSPSSSPEPASR